MTDETREGEQGRAMAERQLHLLRPLENYLRPRDSPGFVTKDEIEEYCGWIRAIGFGAAVDETRE